MQKITFVNNQVPALNATNLNQLQTNVEDVFNGNEPMGDIAVNSIRSKNMFNVKTCVGGNLDNGAVVGGDKVSIVSTSKETGTIVYTSTEAWRGIVSDYIEVEENKTYILNYTRSSTAILTFVVYYNSSKQVVGSTTEIQYQQPTTIPSSVKYIRFILEPNTLVSGNITLSSIQFEKGSSATSFSPYQELNNQENYSLSEQKIGTWINGKPLYRQSFRFNNIPKGQETVITYNNNMDGNTVSNIEDVVDYKCRWVRLNPDDTFNTFQIGVNVWQQSGNVMGEYSFSCYDFSRQSFVFSVGNMGGFKIDVITLTLEYTKTTD